jgi:hypothetical protein
MEFKTEAFVSETSGQMKLSLGLLQISVSIEKNGKWAIGVNAFEKLDSLVCRIQGDDAKVLSTEFPEMERQVKAGIDKLKAGTAQ